MFNTSSYHGRNFLVRNAIGNQNAENITEQHPLRLYKKTKNFLYIKRCVSLDLPVHGPPSLISPNETSALLICEITSFNKQNKASFSLGAEGRNCIRLESSTPI